MKWNAETKCWFNLNLDCFIFFFFQSSVMKTILLCFTCKLQFRFHFWHCGKLFPPGKYWQFRKAHVKPGWKVWENSGAALNVMKFSHYHPAGKEYEAVLAFPSASVCELESPRWISNTKFLINLKKVKIRGVSYKISPPRLNTSILK